MQSYKLFDDLQILKKIVMAGSQETEDGRQKKGKNIPPAPPPKRGRLFKGGLYFRLLTIS
jgi:hypothetical protein